MNKNAWHFSQRPPSGILYGDLIQIFRKFALQPLQFYQFIFYPNQVITRFLAVGIHVFFLCFSLTWLS